MDLAPLRYFQAVARHEHVGRAALELHVTQSSLSRSIARLEQSLGVQLFDRQGRSIRLNRFGAAYLRRVDAILVALDDAQRELTELAGVEGGRVALASETLLTLTGMLAEFRRVHPGTELELRQASAAEMGELLASGAADVCFASQEIPGEGLSSEVMMRERVRLAVPAGHRLEGRSRVKPADLDGEPFVTTGPGHWPRALADRMFEEAGVRPRYVGEGDEPGATLALIDAGLGVGLAPAMAERATREAGGAGVAWMDLAAPDCVRTLRAVTRAGSYRSAAVAALLESARAFFARSASASAR